MSISKKDVEKKLICYMEFFGLEDLNLIYSASQIVRDKHQDLVALLENYLNSVKNDNQKILSPEETKEIKLLNELVTKLKRMDTSLDKLDIHPILDNTAIILREITELENLWDSEFDYGDGYICQVHQSLMDWYYLPDNIFFIEIDIHSKNNLFFLQEYIFKDWVASDNTPDEYFSFEKSYDFAKDTEDRRSEAEEIFIRKIKNIDFITLNIEEVAKQEGWEQSEDEENVVEDYIDEFNEQLNEKYLDIKETVIDALIELLEVKI